MEIEKINGRTPEQIRFNVMECAHGNCLSECPYDSYYECTEGLLGDAFSLIRHLEAKVPRWISIEERLPKYVTSAFVYARLCVGGKICETGSTYISSFIPPTKSWSNVPDGWKVTHWMPLPEPPEVST